MKFSHLNCEDHCVPSVNGFVCYSEHYKHEQNACIIINVQIIVHSTLKFNKT